MATIILCDWFKTRMGKDEDTYKVVIDGQEFEVCKEGADALLTQLTGEEEPQATRTVEVEKIVWRDAPPPTLDAAQPVVGVQISSEPFEGGPGSMPQPVRASSETPVETPPETPDDEASRLQVPEDTTKRLKKATPEQADEVIRKATKFETGSLPSLTVGGRAQREASRRLKAVESEQDKALKRRGKNQGFNVGNDATDKPGYYEE